MKLISESLENVKFLTEEDDKGEKSYKIKGVFMQGNIKNRNGRVYPVSYTHLTLPTIVRG